MSATQVTNVSQQLVCLAAKPLASYKSLPGNVSINGYDPTRSGTPRRSVKGRDLNTAQDPSRDFRVGKLMA